MGKKYHSTHETQLDKFLSWIKNLVNASKGKIVLVGCKRDGEYLEHFGVQNVIYWKQPEFKIVDKLTEENKEVILLFDTNKQGSKMHEHVRTLLQQNKIKVNTRFRKILLASQIKELGGLIKFLKKQVNITPRKGMGGTFFQK